MHNLYEIFDDYSKKLLEKYNIKVEDKILSEEEYHSFLRETNKMAIEDMEEIYDYLDDYFAEQEEQEKESTQ